MKVNEISYKYEVCPHCESKKLSPVGIINFAKTEHCKEVAEVHRTGFLCGNCNRYIKWDNTKFIFDRAEMRRDLAALTKFLLKEKG